MIQLVQNIRRVTKARAEGRRERGAALVEAAIAIPLLLMVIMGSIEFGFAWEAKSASVSGMRSGVLRAATLGDKSHTDMSVLQSVIGEIGADKVNQIEWVMIFKADPAMTEEARIQNCINTSSDCVMYFGGPDGTNSILEQIATTSNAEMVRIANFDDGLSPVVAGAYQCANKADKNWCAAKRTEGDQDVEFGLAVRYRHEWFTGILPFNPPVFQDSTITSTLLHDGATSITPANPIPSTIGQVVDEQFNFGVDPSSGNRTITGAAAGQLPIRFPNDNSQSVLGQFSNDQVGMTVSGLEDHNVVCVSFTLYLLGSWDAPDRFKFTLAGEEVLIQHQWDNPTAFTNPNVTGKMEIPKTGLSASNWPDNQMTVTKCAPHTGDQVSMNFEAIGLAGPQDESWAIDNVTVTVKN